MVKKLIFVFIAVLFKVNLPFDFKAYQFYLLSADMKVYFANLIFYCKNEKI